MSGREDTQPETTRSSIEEEKIMAQTFWRFALHTQAVPPLVDLLSEDDLDAIFGFVVPMFAWDDTARGRVLCNRYGHILAGPFRTRGGA
jgi:hypothetical protein